MANRTANEQRTESLERISRIEEKIDRMTDAIIALARAEEKIMAAAAAGVAGMFFIQ